jgi:flagellar biosynthesis protein FlhF
MKIKRFIADSMRTALAQVRAEQGPDAVILSSRRTQEGIEVIAAVDYDEALFADATRQRAPTATPAPEPKASAPSGTMTRAPPINAPPPDGEYLALRRELRDLSELMRGELAHLSWNDNRMREPLQARVLDELTAMGISADIALALAKLTPRRTNLGDPSHIPLALLVRHVPVVDKLTAVQGGVIALVGPTGAGKTTTIAKLAARWSMQHGSQDLALVSTDRYRIGAREQLMTYARILGAPMHTANSGKDLAQVLHRLKSKKLILIDTAGMGPRDSRLAEQLAALRLGAARARILLALPAQGEAHALEAAVQSFSSLAPTACILTKVDEAASLGAVISTTLRHKLPIAYLCNGQRVPEDLHAAHGCRVWLARTALKLQQHAKPHAAAAHVGRHIEQVPGQAPDQAHAHA